MIFKAFKYFFAGAVVTLLFNCASLAFASGSLVFSPNSGTGDEILVSDGCTNTSPGTDNINVFDTVGNLVTQYDCGASWVGGTINGNMGVQSPGQVKAVISTNTTPECDTYTLCLSSPGFVQDLGVVYTITSPPSGGSFIPWPSIGQTIASTSEVSAPVAAALFPAGWLVLGVIIAVLVVSFIIKVFGRGSKAVLKRRK